MVANRVGNESPKLPETRESHGKYQDFPRLKSDFPRPKSNFPQRLSTFQESQENLSTAASIQKIAIQALYFPPLAPRAS